MAGSGGRTEKRESRERPLRQIQIFKLRGERWGGEMGQAFIQSLRSWPSLFQAFRTDSGMGYGLAIN